MLTLPRIVFSRWVRWTDRLTLDGIDSPGVYVLAHFNKPPRRAANTRVREVIYIGETCGQSLRKRWRQFHRSAFEGKDGHSGGKTYRTHRESFGRAWRDSLCVSAFPVNSLGDELRPLFIRFVERKLILDYARRWGSLPRCNKK